MNQSIFPRTLFHSALAILEPQIYIVVKQFGAENISLLSGRLVLYLYDIYKQISKGLVDRECPFMKMTFFLEFEIQSQK